MTIAVMVACGAGGPCGGPPAQSGCNASWVARGRFAMAARGRPRRVRRFV